MPNEEIISALKNAIDHGDTLQSAVQIMINSGYNSNEVQEASKFVGGTSSIPQPMPEEELTMPEEKKNLSSRFKFWAKNEPQQVPQQSIRTQQPPLTQQPTQRTTQQPSQQTTQQPPQQLPPQQPQQSSQQYQQPTQQLPQHPQQITQAQIKQSFQHPQQSPRQQVPQQPTQRTTQPPPIPYPQPHPQPRPQLRIRQGDLSREIKKIKPKKQGYAKEIILLIILLILIGVLAATIFFKDKILAWFA